MTPNKKGYWAIIALFSLVYFIIFLAGTLSKHTYQCTTDMECYEECVQIGGINCE